MQLKNIISLLGGLWLISIGLRFCTQFIIAPDAILNCPVPFGGGWDTWNFWFDFFPMVIFGSYILFNSMLAISKDSMNRYLYQQKNHVDRCKNGR